MRASFAFIALIVASMLPTATLAQSDEAVFWQSISNSSDGAEFCAYLEAFPNGKFAALAKLRAKKLGASCGGGSSSSAPVASPASVGSPVVSGVDIDPLDESRYVLKAANVRAEPSTNGTKLFVMNTGEQVQVTGKVAGENWYQIKLGGSDRGYIFGTLIGDRAPGQATQPMATADSSASSSTSQKTRDDLAGWDQFMLEVEMFPASRWTGRDDGCEVTLSFEHWKVDPKYTWTRDCNGQTETETKVYALSPGTNWLNLPEDANLVELCRLFANDAGDVKLVGCKYAGIYTNASRAALIIDAMEHYKAGAPEREAERKRYEAENQRLKEEAARKDAIQAKTPYGKRLAQMKGKPFGTAPIPASGQGIVVCSSHRFSYDNKPSGKFPEGVLMNFNASRMELMEAELTDHGITDFDLGKVPWMDREGYSLFDLMNGVIFYDRNIRRQPHPDGEGEIVVGEMLNTPLKQYIVDAPNRVNCEVMIERKTCVDPKDKKGIFSIPCD